MTFTHAPVSEIARGAGYPIKEGWHLIKADGEEMATASPAVAEKLCSILTLLGKNHP